MKVGGLMVPVLSRRSVREPEDLLKVFDPRESQGFSWGSTSISNRKWENHEDQESN